MDWQEQIQLWSRIPVKMWDIRSERIAPGESLQAYRLPANAFLFAYRGEALVRLDEKEYGSLDFLLLHGGKGARLDIWASDEGLDYFLVLYKPVSGFSEQQSDKRPDDRIAFRRPYAYRPSNAILLLALLEGLQAQWVSGEKWDRLQATGLFYQFASEQFRQAELAETEEQTVDLATQIAQYIEGHFREPITLETISQMFHYSTRYLTRVFKRKFDCSPIDFVIRNRMEWSKTLLATTNASISDVAADIGYTDIYYFSRLFKKQTGLTPRQYKLQPFSGGGSIRPLFKSGSFIAGREQSKYIGEKENHYHREAWRVNEMNKGFKPTLAASVLLGLSMLLAACGESSPEPQSTGQTNEPQQSAASESSSETATRKYTDALSREVTIPSSPEKVVVITYGGYLLPLGMKPIGADKNVIDLYPEEMPDVQNIGEGKGNVEAIAALDPDLIIFPDFYGTEAVGLYEGIAPTVAVAWGGDPDVVKTLRTMGDIMNRKPEAEAWISKFDEKLQRIRDELRLKIEPGATALSFIIYDGEVLAGGETGTLGELIYKDFGFQMPKQYKSFANGGGVISLEDLAARPADYFFTQMTEEEMVQTTELFKSPVYQTIPAIKNNRVYNVSREKWNYGPYLVDEGVDELMEHVSKL